MRFWLIRDEDGDLWMVDGKPLRKMKHIWEVDLEARMVVMPKELFPVVKWEDVEPTEIEIKIIKKESVQ